jgi:hypothetical protein
LRGRPCDAGPVTLALAKYGFGKPSCRWKVIHFPLPSPRLRTVSDVFSRLYGDRFWSKNRPIDFFYRVRTLMSKRNAYPAGMLRGTMRLRLCRWIVSGFFGFVKDNAETKS